MLLVGAVIERLASLGVEFQACPTANRSIEFYVRRVQFGLSRFQNSIKTLDQADDSPKHWQALYRRGVDIILTDHVKEAEQIIAR